MTTTPETLAQLKPAVQRAAEGIAAAYPDTTLILIPDGQGGAWAQLEQVRLSDRYTSGSTFVIFLLPFNLPGCDIYPVFVRPDLVRRDGQPLGPALQSTTLAWAGQPAQLLVTQISRRTRGADFAAQPPALKVEKVLQWLRTEA